MAHLVHPDATSTEEITWFRLDRHEDAKTDDETSQDDVTDDSTDPDEAEENAEAEGDGEDKAVEKPADKEGLGDKGKKALDAMKAERNQAKRDAAEAKKREVALAKKVAEFEDRDRTDQEKLAAKAEQAEKRAVEATARAVKAEVKAMSMDSFTDPSDAADVLMRDPAKYVGEDGDIDEDAIRADLEDLLERKPHWRKPEPVTEAEQEQKKTPLKPKPKPDPGQGGRGDKPVDFRNADPATYEAELARMGVRTRR